MPALAEPLEAAGEPDAVPLWFGPPERRAFGWVHRPVSGRARSVLVMCSSLGQEAHFAHYAYKCIAQALARRDVLVIRFDYCGTGDAQDVAVPGDEVARWSACVDDAIALARELTDAPLQLLGLRAGTFLALGAAARHQDVRGLVLWDVPRSGKTWMRELLARHNVAVGAEDRGPGFSALGLTLNRVTARSLRANDLRGVGEIASDRVLLLQRPDTRPALRRATARSGRPLERTEAPEQGPFLSEQAVPTRTMATITSWVSDGAATGPTVPGEGDPARESPPRRRLRRADGVAGSPPDVRHRHRARRAALEHARRLRAGRLHAAQRAVPDLDRPGPGVGARGHRVGAVRRVRVRRQCPAAGARGASAPRRRAHPRHRRGPPARRPDGDGRRRARRPQLRRLPRHRGGAAASGPRDRHGQPDGLVRATGVADLARPPGQRADPANPEPPGRAHRRAPARTHGRPLRRAGGLHLGGRHGREPLEAQRLPRARLGARDDLVAPRPAGADPAP